MNLEDFIRDINVQSSTYARLRNLIDGPLENTSAHHWDTWMRNGDTRKYIFLEIPPHEKPDDMQEWQSWYIYREVTLPHPNKRDFEYVGTISEVVNPVYEDELRSLAGK